MNHVFTRYVMGCVLSALGGYSAVAECGEGHDAFKQFMEHEYLPLMKAHRDSFLDPKKAEHRSLNEALQDLARRDQESALLMLENRERGENRVIGERNLATIAAACGQYEWMREFIESGDDILPRRGSGVFDSPLTLVIAGIGDFSLRIPVEERIKEADWMLARQDNIFAEADLNLLYMAAQSSGCHGHDKGAMFDFLLAKGMPMSWEGVCMLFSVEGSLPIAHKYHVLDGLTDDEREEIRQKLATYDITDKEEKFRYLRCQPLPATEQHSAHSER